MPTQRLDSRASPRRRREPLARTSDADFRRLLDELPSAAYMCDADGLITDFNQHAVRLWGREPQLNNIVDRFCGSFKLLLPNGAPIAHDQCWMALALKNDREYNGNLIVIERPNGERSTVLAHANPIHDESGQIVGAINVLVDMTAQQLAQAAIQKLNVALEWQVQEHAATLRLIQDIAKEVNDARSVAQAMQAALKRICNHQHWPLAHVFLVTDEGSGRAVSSGIWFANEAMQNSGRLLADFQDVTARYDGSNRDSIIDRVILSGQPHTIESGIGFGDLRRASASHLGLQAAIAFPVPIRGEVAAALEFFSQEPMQSDPPFMELMSNVGIQLGHVIERKRLEKTIADATVKQQRDIGRELHDCVLQTLTGVAMTAESLRQELDDAASRQATLAGKLVEYLREVQQQVRQVSRGLMPVEMDAAGLMKALEQLVLRCPDLYRVRCHFACDRPVFIDDDAAAIQLYLIAREAVHNAAQHADPFSITIRLKNTERAVCLTIEDDGVGMPSAVRSASGMGLSIMQYRAGVIGAKLEVVSEPGQGTKIVCTYPVDS